MNWKKPSTTEHPPFKQIVLGLQLPNKIELVKLDRIDETGPVFQRVSRGGLLSDFIDIFGLSNSDIKGSITEAVKIDMYSEIELPKESKASEEKSKENAKK